jgi:LysM repeat protein
MAGRPSPIAAGAALCGACYLVAGYLALQVVPAPVTLGRELGHPHRWIAQYGPDAALAGLAAAVLWLCAVWVAVGLTAMYLSMLPGLAGRCGNAVVRRVLPGAVRRLVAASTGATVLLSPLPAATATATATASTTAPAPAVPAPSWPVARPPGPAARSHPAVRPPAAPAPGWPIDRIPVPPTGATGSPSEPTRSVTVRTGDSLWTIAGTALGPTATEQQIAIAWPYWYRANRSLIGRDPGLIRPGTELMAPTELIAPTEPVAPTEPLAPTAPATRAGR